MWPVAHEFDMLVLHRTCPEDDELHVPPGTRTCYQLWPRSHPLPVPSIRPDHLAPSEGVSGSCQPRSPLKASRPPPAPEGRSGKQLQHAPADGAK
ncbi:hypothetical protein QTO34_006327 [Cnephaeus nilssonii]|uniref:Uncharacterized protein n=1 Tax=Cnephaeus nilssonii TaxID=3371016 RepID=A0AA40HLE1_CNENI|nr:hypothetical protein QTO34_006327 [Eptesicus nilssonii]